MLCNHRIDALRSFLNLRSGRLLHCAATCHDRQSKDVVAGDLAATLEAHRASNLARRIRRTNHSTPLPIRRRRHIPPPTVQPSEGSDGAASLGLEREAIVPSTPSVHGSATPWKASRKATSVSKKWNAQIEGIGAYVPPFAYADLRPFKPYLPEDGEGFDLTYAELTPADECIDRFASWMQITPAEAECRQRLAGLLIDSLKRLVPDFEYEVFGSSVTGLASPTSGIDIAVRLPPDSTLGSQEGRRKTARNALQAIASKETILRDLGFVVFDQRKGIGGPLHLHHADSGLDLHVVYHMNPQRARPFISRCMQEHLSLPALYFLTRTVLDVRGLLSTKAGGLGSHPLLMMLIAYLELTHGGTNFGALGPELDQEARLLSPDELRSSRVLRRFMHFVAHLNTLRHGLTVDPAEIIEKRVGQDETRERLAAAQPAAVWQHWGINVAPFRESLFLLDPMDPANDLGKACRRIMDIRFTFDVLQNELRAVHRKQREGKDVADPLAKFFGNMLGSIRDRRRRANEWYGAQGALGAPKKLE